MPAKPTDWNVVVVGAWNLAILTPDGIARRLFELAQGSPVEVEVPIDQQAPIRVRHSGVMVIPSRSNLTVQPTTPATTHLKRAATIASRGIEQLPVTPMAAAGVNVRYLLDPPPDELSTILQSSADDTLADGAFQIQERRLHRAVKWNEGVLNLDFFNGAGGAGVTFNFHLQSTDPTALQGWLQKVDEMVATAVKLTTTSLHVRVTEGDNA